jgi:hypothetical protein
MEETRETICSNPWCKVIFSHSIELKPKQCPKCQSFDTELSGGVTWTEKKYEGPRWDGKGHEMTMNITKYDK